MRYLFFFLYIGGASLMMGQTDTLTARWLPPIVVTANKQSSTLAETGKRLWVAQSDDMLTSSNLGWDQRLLESGVIVGGAYNNLSKNKELFLRGASSSYTITLIDGVPVIDPSLVGESAYDLRMFSPNETQRLELLKGGYSTLYGSNIVAGGLNFITDDRGQTEALRIQGLLSGGSLSTRQAQLNVSDKIALSPTLRLGYKVTTSYIQSKGISEAEPQSGQSIMDRDGFGRETYSISLPLEVGTQLRLRPYLRYSGMRADTDAGSFTENNSEYFSRFGMGGLHAEWTGKHEKEFNWVFNYAYEAFQSKFTAPNSSFEYPGYFHYTELYAYGALAPRVQILGGLDYRYKIQENTFNNISEKRHADNLNPYLTLDVNEIARSPLNLQVGARLNMHSDYERHYTYHVNPYLILNERLKVHALYATAFKSPGLFNLSLNDALRPERAANTEFGFSVLPAAPRSGVRFKGGMTLFGRDIWDMVTYEFRSSGPTYVNARRQRDYGLELDPTFYGRNWQVRLMYNYTNGHLIRDAEGNTVHTYNLIRRPKHAYQLQGEWRPLQERLWVRLQLQVFGTRTDIHFNPTNFESREVELNPYGLLHGYFSYGMRGNRLRLFAEIRNLNLKRFGAAFKSQPTSNDLGYQDVYGYTPLGVNIYGGLRFDF